MLCTQIVYINHSILNGKLNQCFKMYAQTSNCVPLHSYKKDMNNSTYTLIYKQSNKFFIIILN